jgi:glucosamine-6-phosphate deaminase
MKVIIYKTEKECVQRVADIIEEYIREKPEFVLGLASGGTMISLYKELVARCNERKIDFSKVKFVSLDEFIGLPKEHKNSYQYYFHTNILDKVNSKPENICLYDGYSKNINSECKKIEDFIRKNPVDLQLLGLGRDGHIGFNEPGSKFSSKTRKIKLTEMTRIDDSRFFKNLKETPKFALTQGIGTIMKAKKIILIAYGKHKADAVSKAVQGKVSEKVPASILQKHKQSKIVLDREAASKLEMD